jgi:toxin FitB
MEWFRAAAAENLYITSVNIAELRHGILILSSIERALDLNQWLNETVRRIFEGRVLEVGEEQLLKWRQLSFDLQRKRKPNPPTDLLIAAIAVTNGCGVATRDINAFLATGIPVINSWTGERFNGA